jgi:predicted nuclease of predicted toxin-antitoxin system
MKLLIDAHLPRKTVGWFAAGGCDAIHTLDLPLQNRTPDGVLITLVDEHERILITKDGDFVDSHLLLGRPNRLLLVATGNISNRDLERLLLPLIPTIIADFQTHSFLEVSRTGITIRG